MCDEPHWAAALVFTLAKETGWTADTILDMPISQSWQYRHALLRSYDLNTRFITTKDEQQAMRDTFKHLTGGL